MFGITDFTAFVFAGVLLNVTPGTDTVYILSRSIAQGKSAGILSALGISAGCLVHTLFAALGLSLVLSQSAAAFDVVKYLGALYLVYLGIRALLGTRSRSFEVEEAPERMSSRKIFISGVLTNVLNPKVALFFLAFLPQFIDPSYSESAVPFLLLGLTFVFTGTVWCVVLALGASGISGTLRKNHRFRLWLDRATGGVFLLLGLKLALLKR